MRPPSIIMFERLFLASLALSAIQFFIGYDAMIAEMEREPAFQQLGIGGGALTGTFVVGMAIYLLLWFLIARKASSVAKWILVVLSALGVVTFLFSFAAEQVTFDLIALLGGQGRQPVPAQIRGPDAQRPRQRGQQAAVGHGVEAVGVDEDQVHRPLGIPEIQHVHLAGAPPVVHRQAQATGRGEPDRVHAVEIGGGAVERQRPVRPAPAYWQAGQRPCASMVVRSMA